MPSDVYISLEGMIEWGEQYLKDLSENHAQLNKDLADIEANVPEHKREVYEEELQTNRVRAYSDITSTLYSVVEELVDNRKAILEILKTETINGTFVDDLLEQMEGMNDAAESLSYEFERLQDALEKAANGQ